MPTRKPAEILAYQAMQAAFPLAFPPADQPPRPLAIGTREAVLAWAATRPDLDPRYVHLALCHHCLRIRYRKTLIAGVARINLQGEPTEPVTAEAAAVAAAGVERDLAAAAKRAAAKAEQRQRHLAQQAKLQAAAAARAAKPTKTAAPVKPPAPPRPAAPVAPAPKAAPVVVIKKRRSMVR
jgi:sRNA-binding protein